MANIQRQLPIYQVQINSVEDLDQAINHNERIEEEIAIAVNGKPFTNPFINIYKDTEQLPKYLENVRLFAEAYWGSLGFAPCLDLVKGLNQYQELITETMIACKDKITPLLLRSFACHQKAVHQFLEPSQKNLAIASMAETGAIAKEIIKEYEKIETSFVSLQENVLRILLAVIEEHVLLVKREKALVTQQNTDNGNTPNEQAAFLKRSIFSLDKAIEALWKINGMLLKESFFWKGINASISNNNNGLVKPDLGDPLMVEYFEDTTETDNTFYKQLKEAEKASYVPPEPNVPLGLFSSSSNIPQSIRTGRNTLISDTPAPLTDILISEQSEGVEKKFEKSFLNWLILAKINDIKIDLMENGCVEAQKTQRVILQNESDLLAVETRASADHSNE